MKLHPLVRQLLNYTLTAIGLIVALFALAWLAAPPESEEETVYTKE